jgi:DNA phosphorothioation-dependent restriction protein DptH
VDTILVHTDGGAQVEEAVVVLPTHPLRALWCAAHATLLRRWEEGLLRQERRERRWLVDLDLIGELRPANMPAFAHGWGGDEPLVFFQNLGIFHGIALPAAAPDPLRRFLDVAHVLGFGIEPTESDDRHPERLARHLEDFLTIHPYADPLRLTLINPDQGAFVAATLPPTCWRIGKPDSPGSIGCAGDSTNGAVATPRTICSPHWRRRCAHSTNSSGRVPRR